jgi:N-acyl-phosphatidylethanolamine-hydrolysing phospholipase D
MSYPGQNLCRSLRKIALILPLIVFPACLHAPPFDEAEWRGAVEKQDPALLYTPHFKDGRFFNPWLPMEEKGVGALVRWQLSAKASYTEEAEQFKPDRIPALSERLHQQKGDFIAWIGHNTFLIRLNGQYWLTDPIFSDRALLPKRKTPPALTIEDFNGAVGKLNILISHNHHDHLDKNSILKLPADARIIAPLGLGKLFQSWGRSSVQEMDWWKSLDAGDGITLVCLPAQHWSRRFGQGTNESLWASFLLISPSVKIYFGGDSGYFVGYQEIGRKYPGIDYALLPTTAYHPRWFMHYAHLNAEETLDAFLDLGARWLIPTQWGTFRLGNEPIGYPVIDLRRAMKSRGFDASRGIILDLGGIQPILPKSNKGGNPNHPPDAPLTRAP